MRCQRHRGPPVSAASSPRKAAQLGREWLARVGLDGFAIATRTSSPAGMRKRTALAQILILDPKILLMDEPFLGARYPDSGSSWRTSSLELWSANRKSVIFITHDLEEAISLSDRVVVLSARSRYPSDRRLQDRPCRGPRDVAEIRLTPRFIECTTASGIR
jgi:NitT/TauT family transport system ATP-binding protein